MRLDKFVGKASAKLTIHVSDWDTNEKLLYIPDASYYYPIYMDEMKQYKVKYYEVKNNQLYIDVTKKED